MYIIIEVKQTNKHTADCLAPLQAEKITNLNAAVLLRSPSRHQTLDVDSSVSHVRVDSSLLAKY